MKVLGIDPGFGGAFVAMDGLDFFNSEAMPLETAGKEKRIVFRSVIKLLKMFNLQKVEHIFLERAVPMAMGSKGAFNYGRGFETLVVAIEQCGIPMTMVEPSRWTKEMHEGISADLKPKAKSLIAVNRLYPRLVDRLPRKPKGALHDGPIDALLIAGYGLRRLKGDAVNFY